MQAIVKNPLIIALDVDNQQQALRLAESLQSMAGCFKLGPRLLNRYGEKIIKEIKQMAPVFVDCKFFDIPNTMQSSVAACFEAGANLVTVHALSGRQALQQVAKIEQEFSRHQPCKVLAVTILTSWDQDSLPAIIKNEPIPEHVKSLVALAQSSGITGVVCSAEELSLIKDESIFKVTPGIRFQKDNLDDQKRVVSPSRAMALGASALVIGRPIIDAPNPKQAAIEFLQAIQGGQQV